MTDVYVLLRGVMLHVPRAKDNKITVLMPVTGTKHFGKEIELHEPELLVPKWKQPGQSLTWDLHTLGRDVDIPFRRARGTATALLPPKMPNVTKVAGEKVPGNYLKRGKKASKAVTRLHLWQGHSISSTAPGHDFQYDGQIQPFVDHLIWSYQTDKEVEIQTKRRKVRVPQLDGVPFIFFALYHMPKHVMTRKMINDILSARCREATHFYALFSFFKDPKVEVPRHHPEDCGECKKLRLPKPPAGGLHDHGHHPHDDQGGSVPLTASMLNPGSVLDYFPLSDPVTCVGGGGEG